MATMNISLPDALKIWAESRTETGLYDTTSDYVRDLIRRDQDRETSIAEFRALINTGLASGVSSRTMDDLWLEAVALSEQRQPA